MKELNILNAILKSPQPINEPVLDYGKNSKERKALKEELENLRSKTIKIPLIIGGQEIYTEEQIKCIVPHDKEHVIGYCSVASEKEADKAIKAALDAKRQWESLSWNDRQAIFLKAANLLSTKYRAVVNAATMLAQSKTVYQAEIDAVCELCDFLRFNVNYLDQIYGNQPLSDKSTWNKSVYRPLEGFVFAVTPFNFTSIAGNLPTAPAIAGNTVVWKPASASVYSSYYIMKLLIEAGLPPGVVNFVPGKGSEIGQRFLTCPNLAGVHFTGSTKVFQSMWKTVGSNIEKYKTYPRMVGETGGKDFVFAHSSADLESLGTALIRGAFEYQGQKCSAASRAYIPESIWFDLKEYLVREINKIKMGSVDDFRNFMGALINEKAYDKVKKYIQYAKESKEAKIVIGGHWDNSKGYFVEPTVIQTSNPKFATMEEEIFGPVLTVYVYDDKKLDETLKLCDKTSGYGLTGAVFSQDSNATAHMREMLINSAGNFYINDKPTGAVVGRQPFGGARHSGTNDKAGSMLNILRWISPLTIKENFLPPTGFEYPHMEEK